MMAALLMGLTGCSNEDFPGADSNVPAGKPVAVTLTVGRGAEATRTTLTPEGLGLKDEWDGDEELSVFNNKGIHVGTVSFTGYVNGDKKVANFSGEVTAEDGTNDFYVWYLGKKTDSKQPYAKLDTRTVDGNLRDVVNVLVENQSGKFEDLAYADVMSAATKLTVVNNHGTNAEKVNLTNRLCMLRIDLGIQGGAEVSGATLKIKNGESNILDKNYFIPQGEKVASSGANTLTINNVNTAEDVYFALVPGDYTLSFELTKGANTYTATLNPNKLEAGVYYTNGNSTNPGGVKVELQSDEEPVNHDLNPLLKWAPGDLVREGSGADATGRILDSYKESGYFFQFGRNYSYRNYSDAQRIGHMAAAAIEQSWTSYSDGSRRNVYAGTGYNQKVDWYYPWQSQAKYPEDFLFAGFMNATNLDGDYLSASGIKHSQTWAQRATYNGYTNETPCPEGWRIPKLADWKQILPKGGHTYTGSNFETIYEIKELDDAAKSRYAIRWSREIDGGNQYLKIEAIMIPSSVTDPKNAAWDDKENVKTLHFKAAGAIKPLFMQATLNNGTSSVQLVAKPIPIGDTYNTTEVAYQNGIAIGYVMKVNITRDDSSLGGFYWMDEPGQYIMQFRFDEKNLQQQGSYINAYAQNTPFACNIRCIRK